MAPNYHLCVTSSKCVYDITSKKQRQYLPQHQYFQLLRKKKMYQNKVLQTADERYFKKEWYLPHVLFWGKSYRNHTVKICPYPKENMRKITFFFEGMRIAHHRYNLFWYCFFFVNSQKCKKSPSLLVREHGTPILWASHISWLRYLSSMRKFPFGREVHYYMSSHATIIFANS